MNYNIKKLEKLFADIADRHLQIGSFGYGMDFAYDNKKQLDRGMVSLWVQPLTSQAVLSRSNTQVVRRFRLYVFDLVRRDEKNLISVWNSTEEILIDFIRLFSFSYSHIKLSNSPVFVPFTETNEDDLSGYYTDIDLTSYDLSGDCEIPIKSILPPPIPPQPTDDWQRPDDWLPMPTVTDTDETFVALHAIHPSGQNFCAFKFTTSSGQYRVDWGDGTITLYNSDEAAEHDYNYGTYDTNNTTLSTRGYKQAIIVVTPVSGNLLTCDFRSRYTTTPAQIQSYSTGFLDCILSMPNAQSISFGSDDVGHRYVERFDIKNSGNITTCNRLFLSCSSLQSVPLFDTSNVGNMFFMFFNCSSIRSVPLFNTSNVTTFSQMFHLCSSLQSVPLFDTSNVNNMTSMFSSCNSLKSVPLFNTQNVTNMSNMFTGCNSLKSVPLFNTQNVTNMSNMFTGCNSLQSVPLFNTSMVTSMFAMFNFCSSLQSVPLFNTQNVTSMAGMFTECFSIENIPAFNTSSVTDFGGANVTIGFTINCHSLNSTDIIFTKTVRIDNCQLSRDALVNIFNNLSDLTSLTTQNITINGNWGTSALTSTDRDIALNKNWTITG